MKRKIEETLGFIYISFLSTPCNLQSKYHLVRKSLAESFSVIERVTKIQLKLFATFSYMIISIILITIHKREESEFRNISRKIKL